MRMGVQEDCCLGIPGTHACCTSRQCLGQQQIINGIRGLPFNIQGGGAGILGWTKIFFSI